MNKRFLALSCAVGLAALFRLAPHPPNFTPIEALALFGGASFASRRTAFLVPLVAMFLSDVVLGFMFYGARIELHSQPVVYVCILATVAIGRLIRGRRSVQTVVAASVLASVLFFVVTNFSVWAAGSMYPKTLNGLAGCYVAAIPFFRNALAGDLTFTALLFGGFALVERMAPALREAEPCGA